MDAVRGEPSVHNGMERSKRRRRSVWQPQNNRGKLDITKILNWKDYAGSYAKTNYGLVYGNGNDFIPATHIPALQVRADQHIDGWHMPVNQDDYYNDPRSQNDSNAVPRQN